LAKAVDDMGWTLPTDVQAEAIPLVLGGGDVLMAAETGSGKTGAFCLPLLQITWESLKELQDRRGGKKKKVDEPERGAESGQVTMSKQDRSPELAVSPDGLRCQSRHVKEWHGCRATRGVAGRQNVRVYYEAMVEDEGLCRVGFSTSEASLDLGTCRFGFGFGGTGKKSNNRQFDDYGGAFGKGDVIGCYLDLDNAEIAYTKNGVDLGLAFSISEGLSKQAFFPAVVLKVVEPHLVTHSLRVLFRTRKCLSTSGQAPSSTRQWTTSWPSRRRPRRPLSKTPREVGARRPERSWLMHRKPLSLRFAKADSD